MLPIPGILVPYYFFAYARYQVFDQDESPVTSNKLYLQESIRNSYTNGIGPDNNGAGWGFFVYPGNVSVGATPNTDSSGTFGDVPVGGCTSEPSVSTAEQLIRVVFNAQATGAAYVVRDHQINSTTTGANYGRFYNGRHLTSPCHTRRAQGGNMNALWPLEGWNEVVSTLLKVRFEVGYGTSAGWGLFRHGLLLFVNGKPQLKLWPIDGTQTVIRLAVFDKSGWRELHSWTKVGNDLWRSSLSETGATQQMVAAIEKTCREAVADDGETDLPASNRGTA